MFTVSKLDVCALLFVVFRIINSHSLSSQTQEIHFVNGQLDDSVPESIFFSVTVRDFISGNCDPSDEAEYDSDNNCPDDEGEVRSGILSGEFEGHPDFESVSISCVGDSVYSGFPLTANSCGRKPFVRPYMETPLSGIPKLVLCPESDTANCEGSSNHRPESADSLKYWYQDSKTFNKRFGYFQELSRVSGLTFRYDSDIDSGGFYDPFDISGVVGNQWPVSSQETSQSAGDKFWFTTEIHTFFQYNAGDEFTFSGDDDVFVFINNTLAIDRGGVESRREITIELDHYREELGIEVGGVYAFDLFHAERRTEESNYALTTSLSTTCNVVSTARVAGDRSVVIDWPARFVNDPDQLFILGGPGFGFVNETESKVILMQDAIYSAVGYMYFRQQSNIGGGFTITSAFVATGEGEGIALVWQDSTNGIRNLNGGVGPNFGLRNLDNYYAVVFDFCPERSNCDGATVSLRRNGEIAAAEDLVHLNLQDGEPHEVEINFYGDVPNWVEVYIDQSLYLVERDADMLAAIGSRNSYVGWTATSNVDILSFQMVTVNVAEEGTIIAAQDQFLLENNFEPKRIIADEREVASFTIQTRDFCGAEINFGGKEDQAFGAFVEEINPETNRYFNGSETPLVGMIVDDTIIQDNNDGTYSIQLSTRFPGNYSVFLAFGDCIFNETTIEFSPRDSLDSSSICWTSNFTYAVAVDPVPPEEEIDEDTPTGGLPQETLLGLGIGGGLIAVIGSFTIFFFVKRYRDAWRRDKQFIDAGKAAKADEGVSYDGNTEADVIARRLMETRAALNAEKVRGGTGEDLQQEIENLTKQNEEIQSQLKDLKKKNQQQDVVSPNSEGHDLGTKPGRKVFGASQV